MTQNKSFEIAKTIETPKPQTQGDKITNAFAFLDTDSNPPWLEEIPQELPVEQSPKRIYPHSVLEKNEVNFSVSTINNTSLEQAKSEPDEKSEDSVVIESEAELLSAPKNEKEEEFTLFGVTSYE